MIPFWALLVSFCIALVVQASEASSADNSNSSNGNSSKGLKRGRDEDEVTGIYHITTETCDRLPLNASVTLVIANHPVTISIADDTGEQNDTIKFYLADSAHTLAAVAPSDDKPDSSDDDKEYDDAMNDSETPELAQVYSRYCNVKDQQQNGMQNRQGRLVAGNFLLFSDQMIDERQVNTLMHGMKIGAVSWYNIQAALLTLFPQRDIRMILMHDFPCPTQLKLPEMDGFVENVQQHLPQQQQMEDDIIWHNWPLRYYISEEIEECNNAFDPKEDKDAALLELTDERCLNILSETYLQLKLFTRICRDLSFDKPWTLYESLLNGTFVPSRMSANENIVVAYYLIARDPDVMPQLVPSFDTIMNVAKQQESETFHSSLLKLSHVALSIFGVCEQSLNKVLQKYSAGSIFTVEAAEDDQDMPIPEYFMQCVDDGNLSELYKLDAPLTLSLIRHFLLCPPPSELYMRTLLWVYRNVAPFMTSRYLGLIRSQMKDEASRKAWQLATAHCTNRVRKRSSVKRIRYSRPMDTNSD